MVDTDLAKHAGTASSSCGLLLDFRHRASRRRTRDLLGRPGTVAGPPGREGTALSRLAANLSRPRSRRKLADFHDAAVEARRPEVAEKGLALWPAILVALRAQQDEADQPVGCGCHNMINYQHHILSHIVVTRPQKSALNGTNLSEIRKAEKVDRTPAIHIPSQGLASC